MSKQGNFPLACCSLDEPEDVVDSVPPSSLEGDGDNAGMEVEYEWEWCGGITELSGKADTE